MYDIKLGDDKEYYENLFFFERDKKIILNTFLNCFIINALLNRREKDTKVNIIYTHNIINKD